MPKRFYTPGHFIRLIHSGSQYFETLCHLIDSATQVLHLQVYILSDDDTGKLIINHLKKAAGRGVTIFLLADSYGSKELHSGFVDLMKSHGINFRFFSPIRLLLPFNAGRRMHRKVCVADGLRAITGGINIADKYRGSISEKAWLDYAVYIEGPLCRDLELICEEVWTRRISSLGTRIDDRKFSRSGGMMARITENDWLRRKNQISASYKQKLRTANDSIIIIASYFLPTRRLLKILLRAALRGKKISIILSKHSDVPFIKPAMSYLYNRLLKNGIKIYEYDKSILHAKAVVVDNRWTSIGSHNLNHLSEFISMEINIEILDKNFGESFSNELMLLTKHHCQEIKLEEYERNHSRMQKISEWFSYKTVSISQWILEMVTRRTE